MWRLLAVCYLVVSTVTTAYAQFTFAPTCTFSQTPTRTPTPTAGGPTRTFTPTTGNYVFAPGTETRLIANPTRTPLGIVIGPDGMTARLDRGDGTLYAYLAGQAGNVSAGRTMRLLASTDFSTVARSPNDITHYILLPGKLQPNPHGTTAADMFDWDYAAGGQVIQCPFGGKLLYIYHGENHTDPSGYDHTADGLNGWAGEGIAYWDEASQIFVKDDQILGLNPCNTWCGTGPGANTCQFAAQGGETVVYNPDDGYLYTYYDSRITDPEYRSFGSATDKFRGVSRALLSDVCTNMGTGTKTPWFNWWHEGWTQPAVNVDGTGGLFTPLWLPAQNTFTVSVFRMMSGLWLMAEQVAGQGIAMRHSFNGINWSNDQNVVPPPTPGIFPSPGVTPFPAYPYLYDVGSPSDVGLQYTRFQSAGNIWAYAELDSRSVHILPPTDRTCTPNSCGNGSACNLETPTPPATVTYPPTFTPTATPTVSPTPTVTPTMLPGVCVPLNGVCVPLAGVCVPLVTCVGDCNGNGITTPAECALCNQIRLGSNPLSDCPQCSINGVNVTLSDVQQCTFGEIGCWTPTPTRTPTP